MPRIFYILPGMVSAVCAKQEFDSFVERLRKCGSFNVQHDATLDMMLVHKDDRTNFLFDELNTKPGTVSISMCVEGLARRITEVSSCSS